MRLRVRRKATFLLLCLVILFFLTLQLYEEYDILNSQKAEQELSRSLMSMSLNWESTNNQPRPCKPVNNILFLKTHKTGSSTITNLLNRYGDKNDLIFTFPFKSFWFHWPLSFRLSFVEDTFGRAPNILCNHARYNRAPMNWLFPKETSRYITILREPVQQFESVFNFFNLGSHFNELKKVPSKLEAFLDNTTFYFNQAKGQVKKNLKITLNLLKNPSLFDLGLDTYFHEDLTVVRDYIRFLEQEFDLVMLMEYFDESLVLLKRRFCWKFEDILYFKLNERGDKHVRNNNLTRKVTEQIRKWNAGDVLLYDFFNQTLWRMIKEEGPGFFSDLALFRKELKAVKSACLQEGKFLTELIPRSRIWVQGYALRTNISTELNNTCYKMIMNEIPFLTYLRDKKKKKLEAIEGSLIRLK